MGVTERRKRQKQFLRREILDAARSLFIRDGYENVSMRRIAEKIEYSPTTIYLYFKDKAELLDSICAETFEKLIQKLERIRKTPGDPVERLKRGLHAYVEFGLENLQHYKVTFVLPNPQHDEAEKHFKPDTAGYQAFRHLQTAVGECIKSKRFRSVDVDCASQALWAAVHGITSLLIVHHRFPWVERRRLINQVIDSAVEGLAR